MLISIASKIREELPSGQRLKKYNIIIDKEKTYVTNTMSAIQFVKYFYLIPNFQVVQMFFFVGIKREKLWNIYEYKKKQ